MVLEGSVGVATVAIVLSAVNILLLGEIHLHVVLDGVVSLEGSSGGEGPAGTASALVAHVGDNTFGGPVDFGGINGVGSMHSVGLGDNGSGVNEIGLGLGGGVVLVRFTISLAFGFSRQFCRGPS